jgi:hypothetical protein
LNLKSNYQLRLDSPLGGHPLICFTPLLGYEDSNLKTHHFTKWQIENSSKTRRLKFTLALCFSHRFGGKDTGGNFIDKKAGVQATREIVLEALTKLADRIGGSEESCNSNSVFVIFILTLFRPTLTRIAMLANAAPGMICLSTSASSTSATSALRLKGAAHFVAIDGTRKSQGHRASLYLHAKRHVVSSNASSQRRGPTHVLKRAAQFGTVLLDLHCGLLGTTPGLP